MPNLAYVRATAQSSNGGGTTVATPASVVTAGNHVFVFLRWHNADPTITLTDTAGNTYTPVALGTFNNAAHGRWFYKLNATGHAANIITATWGATVQYRMIRVIELSGTAPTVTQIVNSPAADTTFIDVDAASNGVDVGAGGAILIGQAMMYDTGNNVYTQSERDPLTISIYGGGALNYANTAYALAPSGAYHKDVRIASTDSTARTMAVLALDIGGAVPTGTTVLKTVQMATEVVGQADPALRVAQTAVEVVQRPGGSNLRCAQLVVEVIRANGAPIVNDRDLLLQATVPRYSPSTNLALILTGTAPLFHVSSGGGASPTSITVSAQLIGMTGTVAFAATGGSALSILGNTATLAYADMLTANETITASITSVEGVLYTGSYLIGSVADGAAGTAGARSPGQFAFSGHSSWSDAAAVSELAAAGYGSPINRDIVTLYDASHSTTKFYSSGAWYVMTAYIDGNLLVSGTVSCAALDTDIMTGQEIRTAASGARIEINHQTAGVGDNMLRAYDAAGNMLAEIGAGATGGLVAANSSSSGVGAIWGYSSASGPGVVGINVSTSGNGTTGNIQNSASAAAGVVGTTDGIGVGVFGETTGASGSAIAVLGVGNSGTEGWVGPANGYDFYAAGSGTNYGPFTGAHDCLIPKGIDIEAGDIVIDVACIERAGWSNTIFEVRRSAAANEAGAVGIVANLVGNLNQFQPAVFVKSRKGVDADGKPVRQVTMSAQYHAVKGLYKLAAANALGEGQMNVTGEGGNIAVGDLIVTSSTPGKGMRQSDGVLRNITVARAREAVVFASPGEIRKIACIYLCG